MDNLILQIDGKPVWLADDTSITIEKNSSIWTDSSTLSYQFELSISKNRHIFFAADEGHGNSIYDAVENKRFRLFVMGIPFMTGIVKLENEVSLGGDKVEISLVSDNFDMDEIIGSLKARHLNQSRRIKIGECLGKAVVDVSPHFGSSYPYQVEIDNLPEQIAFSTVNYSTNVSSSNVSLPYPQAMYCNTRICWQHYDTEDDKKIITDQYDVLEADRQGSGICFYMMYFLECVFSHFNIPIMQNDCLSVDDLCRVAMLNLGCSFDRENIAAEPVRSNPNFRLRTDTFGYTWTKAFIRIVRDDGNGGTKSEWTGEASAMVYGAEAIANSKNFPNKGVKEILEAIENGFGIRFLYDSSHGTVQIVLLQKLLAQTDYETLKCEVWEQEKIENAIRGFRLKYDAEKIAEDEEERLETLEQTDRETDFSYDDYSHVKMVEFGVGRQSVGIGDINTYIDGKTGNAYRTKENKEAKEESELQPRLYEVGQYGHVDYGDCSDEDRTETVTIGFSPLVINDVNYRDSMEQGKNEEIPAYFLFGVGEALSYAKNSFSGYPAAFKDMFVNVSNVITFEDKGPLKSISAGVWAYRPNYYDTAVGEEDPIATFDCGLTFGIMRGPGAKAGTSYFDENYDGEGNSKWVQTPGNYAMTDDICDHFGNLWDYNGDAEGLGGTLKNRFSLKLKAEKPNPEGGYFPITDANLQKRGIFDRLYSNYAFWVTNADTMRFTVGMEIADILAIDMSKKYKIGNFVGFIKKMSFSVSREGLSSVTIDLLYI